MLIDHFKKHSRDPLLLFTVVGVLIFTLYYSLEESYQPTIRLSSTIRVQLIEDFEAITGRKVTPERIAQLEKDFIADEILFRDAISAGMHLIDPATRSSLIEKMRFRISALIQEPSDIELVDHYAQNMQRYYTETSLSFQHIYFTKLPINADRLILKLQSGELVNGDKFVHGNQFSDLSEGMLRGIFGDEFLTALKTLESMQWRGPFSSSHGLHYVRLHNKIAPQPIPFRLAKNIITNDLMQLKIEQAVASKIQFLVAQYEINIEP
jgi:parvulin-like peptidyl-prolyl isomerase